MLKSIATSVRGQGHIQRYPTFRFQQQYLPFAISKANFATKDKKSKKRKKEGGTGEGSKNSWYIKIVDSPPGPRSQALTEEQRKRNFEIGHRYNVEFNRRLSIQDGDLHRKIKLKLEAIRALPVALQEEANTIDYTPFPSSRRIPTWTPPIPGFDAGLYDMAGSIN